MIDHWVYESHDHDDDDDDDDEQKDSEHEDVDKSKDEEVCTMIIGSLLWPFRCKYQLSSWLCQFVPSGNLT